MPAQPRKMSEILKKMSETLLRGGGVPSSGRRVALLFANVAWNRKASDWTTQGTATRGTVEETIEADNPRNSRRIQVERHQRHD